ncbi:MAG TPA: DMT family transporter, partial [Myxococcales bacterium]|nr:DMT family transporter [Myxococcales bacterium]
MDKRTLGAFGFAVVTWASAFPAIHIALAAYSPAQLAFFRFLLAAVMLLAIGAAAGLRMPPLRDVLRMALLGTIGIALYAVALGYGQKEVPAGSASLLIASAPVWMVIIAAAIGRERPGYGAILGIAISFSGVAAIAAGRGLGFSSAPHTLAVLLAAVAGATYTIAQKSLVSRYGALRFTIAAAWGGALVLSPAAIGLPAVVHAAPPSATIAVVYLAIFPGALGYASWSYASARASAAVAGSALYLIPAVSMVLSNLMLGEVPSARALVGGALVLAGV